MTMSSMFLNVRILSPSATIFEGKVQTCLIPTPEGPMKILPRHMSVAGRLSHGKVHVTHDDGHQDVYGVEEGGFYRISPDSVHLWIG